MSLFFPHPPSGMGMARRLAAAMQFLSNPWVSVAAIILGVALGLADKPSAMKFKDLGDMFVAVLSMSCLPIILTIVTTSIARTLRTGSTGRYLMRTAAVFVSGALLAASLTVFIYILGLSFWSIGSDTMAFLGKILAKTSIPVEALAPGNTTFLKTLVPQNVFGAFSSGQLLPMLLVSVLVGCAVGLMPNGYGDTLLSVCDDINQAFTAILNWSLCLLPFGIFGLMASSVAEMGSEVIAYMGFVIVLNYLSMTLLCALYLYGIRRAAGRDTLKVASTLREPIFISFVTMDPFPALPSAMSCLSKELRLPQIASSFGLPLTITLNGHNLVVQLVLSALFTACIYNIPLTPGFCLTVILLSSFPGSLAGPSLPTLLGMVPYVFGPLGLPVEPGMQIILLTGPILAPICGVHTLLSGCANAALISNISSPTHAPERQSG